VAAMVWLIRVLIIGTFSVAGERLFTIADAHASYRNRPIYSAPQQPYAQSRTSNLPANSYPRPAPKPAYNVSQPIARPEPTYHPIGMGAMQSNKDSSTRK